MSNNKIEVYINEFSERLVNVEEHYNIECELFFSELNNGDEAIVVSLNKEDLKEEYRESFKEDLVDLMFKIIGGDDDDRIVMLYDLTTDNGLLNFALTIK